MKDFRTHTIRTNAYLLADKAKITEEQADEALKIFLSPDKHSLNPANEGRRLKKLEAGEYLVLNGAWWARKMATEKRKEADRVRKRKPVEDELEDAPEAPSKPRFSPPTTEEVRLEMTKQGFPVSKAEEFIAHYEKMDWTIKEQKIRKWQACVTTWRLKWEKDGRPGLVEFGSSIPQTREAQDAAILAASRG